MLLQCWQMDPYTLKAAGELFRLAARQVRSGLFVCWPVAIPSQGQRKKRWMSAVRIEGEESNRTRRDR